MHSIVKDLYDICMNNVNINLKSLLNTIYNDKHIRVLGCRFEDIEDLYEHIESSECYNWFLGLSLYNEGFHPARTPYVYRYSYLHLDVYDEQYDDWFELTVYFSKEDVMYISNYLDNYADSLSSAAISINDDIRIVSILYNHSFEADMNLYDPENTKLIREGNSLRQHLPEMEDFYRNETRRMAKLLKSYEEGDKDVI